MIASNFADEHLFNGYWRQRIQEGPLLSKGELQEMLNHPFCDSKPGSIRDGLIELLSSKDKASPTELYWLLEYLPTPSKSRASVLARLIVNRRDIDSIRRLEEVLELGCTWAGYQVLEEVPNERAEEARQAILGHARTKMTKHNLVDFLRRRLRI